jgi:hypothetical protein
MEQSQLISAFCAGGALLGFWLQVRFPRLGPKTLAGAAVAVVVAFGAASVVLLPVEALVSAWGRTGGLVALVGLVLPALAAIFWSAACLLRAFSRLLTGMR